MERVITLQIPEKTYALLEKEAKGRGVEPAQMILEWVNKVVRQEPVNATSKPAKTPEALRALFGTLACDVVGVAESHDVYLTEQLDEDLHSV